MSVLCTSSESYKNHFRVPIFQAKSTLKRLKSSFNFERHIIKSKAKISKTVYTVYSPAL